MRKSFHFLLSQASEEKLKLAQEELAGNQTYQTGLEAQIKELQVGRSSLEQALEKLNQKLQQQEQTLKDSEKQQVSVLHSNIQKHNYCFYKLWTWA